MNVYRVYDKKTGQLLHIKEPGIQALFGYKFDDVIQIIKDTGLYEDHLIIVTRFIP